MVKGTRSYYFKTIGSCSRTKVKSPHILGTSHNLSWSGGVEEKLGGLQFFLDGIWGAFKCQKMTLGGGGSSSFF